MRYRVLPYRQGSRSAKALAEALGGKVLKLQGSTFVKKSTDIIINWGNTSSWDCEFITYNKAGLISWCSNKLKFFQRLEEQGCSDIIPKFWTNKEDIPDDAFPIVCRTVLAGHSGEGIHIAASRDDLVDCSLYVKYEKKKDEYRVHCSSSRVICVQRKARRLDCEDVNWQVRNHNNGFVFVRNDVSAPAAVMCAAFKAIEQTGLDFGAVDVIWNEKKEKAYVLEINTAPGLEGQTITDYAEFFKSIV